MHIIYNAAYGKPLLYWCFTQTTDSNTQQTMFDIGTCYILVKSKFWLKEYCYTLITQWQTLWINIDCQVISIGFNKPGWQHTWPTVRASRTRGSFSRDWAFTRVLQAIVRRPIFSSSPMKYWQILTRLLRALYLTLQLHSLAPVGRGMIQQILFPQHHYNILVHYFCIDNYCRNEEIKDIGYSCYGYRVLLLRT